MSSDSVRSPVCASPARRYERCACSKRVAGVHRDGYIGGSEESGARTGTTGRRTRLLGALRSAATHPERLAPLQWDRSLALQPRDSRCRSIGLTLAPICRCRAYVLGSTAVCSPPRGLSAVSPSPACSSFKRASAPSPSVPRSFPGASTCRSSCSSLATSTLRRLTSASGPGVARATHDALETLAAQHRQVSRRGRELRRRRRLRYCGDGTTAARRRLGRRP
jgi:hypothetical protein